MKRLFLILPFLLMLASVSQAAVDNAVCTASDQPGCTAANMKTNINEEIGALSNRAPLELTSVTGTDTIIACTLSPVINTYSDRQMFSLKPAADITAGPHTLNICGIGAKSLLDLNGSTLASGSVKSTSLYTVVYYADGDQFRIISPLASTGTLSSIDIDTSAELRAIVSDEVGTGAAMFGLDPAMADDLSCTGSQVVRRNSGDTAFECATVSGGGGTPGGSSGQVQYNNAGAFGGFTVGGDATLNTGTGALTIGTGAVNSAKISDGTVANADLANMATQTIKGRTTAGTGAPEDLTATQATAILNNMVGDSGSGGTKGLVPAPAAGDTAAGKFLKADGSWSVPAGGGGGSPGGTSGQIQYNNGGAFGGFTVSGDGTINTGTGVLEVTQADALESNGANCSAGQYPLGVDTAGAAESCTADDDVPDAGEVDDTALAAGAVDGGTGGEIADGSVTAADLGTDSVAADEIASSAVGSSEIADGAVANADLANMATATFKGRTTAGTGVPEDLSAAQATALLNAMVGDSGSGGTKGLVPAPASGDASAGKYLKADGTWGAPTATAALSSLSDDVGCTGSQVVRRNAGDTAFECATVSGTGDVAGPSSATDNAIARFDTTTGKIIQNSVVTISDAGTIATAGGTTSDAPITMQSGSLKTTPGDGDIEVSADAIYASTDAGNRGYIPVRHVIRQATTRTLTSSTAEQAIFNTTTNGRLTLETGVYSFDCVVGITSMHPTSGNLSSFDILGSGTATIDQPLYFLVGQDSLANQVSAVSGLWSSSAQSVGAATATTSTALGVTIRGSFRISAAGSIQPAIALTSALAAVVSVGSYCAFDRMLGSSNTQAIGQWD